MEADDEVDANDDAEEHLGDAEGDHDAGDKYGRGEGVEEDYGSRPMYD